MQNCEGHNEQSCQARVHLRILLMKTINRKFKNLMYVDLMEKVTPKFRKGKKSLKKFWDPKVPDSNVNGK